MPKYENVCFPTEEQVEAIEKEHSNAEWVEVKGKVQGAKPMYFAFKSFDAQVYYAAINQYNATQDISVRNMIMTTGHLINGLQAYQSDSEIRIFLDAFAQNMIDLTRVAFKKKPTFTK